MHPSKILYDKGFRELKRLEKDAEHQAMLDPVDFRIRIDIVEALISVGIQKTEIDEVVFFDVEDTKPRWTSRELTRSESDRAYRLARIVQLAERVFGSHEKAFMWLRLNNDILQGHSPISRVETETGARVVEELLIRIDHGIAA